MKGLLVSDMDAAGLSAPQGESDQQGVNRH